MEKEKKIKIYLADSNTEELEKMEAYFKGKNKYDIVPSLFHL